MVLIDKSIELPQVKKVTLELIPPFDYMFVRGALKKKKFSIEGLKWPEAIKAMHKEAARTENKLLHLKSCCDVALNNVTSFKDYLYDEMNGYPKKRFDKAI